MRLVSVSVTGFGPFDGKSNPTEELIGELECDALLRAERGCSLGEREIVDVSVSAVEKFWKQRADDADGKAHRLWVHFGVHRKAKSFRLEAVAHNEASFGRPDVEGVLLENVCVRAEDKFKQCIRTKLPLERIRDALIAKGHPCVVSDDPGRYLCNYIYYTSLKRRKPDDFALFVHVPGFDAISKASQKRFASDLLCCLVDAIRGEDDKLV